MLWPTRPVARMSAGAHRPVSVDGGTKWEGLSPLRRKADVSSRHECRRLQRIGTQTGGSKARPTFGFAAGQRTLQDAERRARLIPNQRRLPIARKAEGHRVRSVHKLPACGGAWHHSRLDVLRHWLPLVTERTDRTVNYEGRGASA